MPHRSSPAPNERSQRTRELRTPDAELSEPTGRDASEAASAEEAADLTVLPLPSTDTQGEHDRVRRSNDRDQRLEREGKPSRHNAGYDEAADGAPAPAIERVTDEP
jgi:hypothetical protein